MEHWYPVLHLSILHERAQNNMGIDIDWKFCQCIHIITGDYTNAHNNSEKSYIIPYICTN